MGWMAPLRHLSAKVLVDRKPPANREPSMNEITTVGLDLAKNVLFPPGPFRFLVDGHRPAIVGHELDSALF